MVLQDQFSLQTKTGNDPAYISVPVFHNEQAIRPQRKKAIPEWK
jgi:hypothetical protein